MQKVNIKMECARSRERERERERESFRNEILKQVQDDTSRFFGGLFFINQSSKFRRPELVSGPQKAFTLAEVLITLAIIGVVAALTIPTVVRNYQERQLITQLKKAYNTLNQAINSARAEYGPIESWDWSTDAVFKNYLYPKMKISKICTIATSPICLSTYKYLWGTNIRNGFEGTGAIAADGMGWAFHSYANSCTQKNTFKATSKYYGTTCAYVFVDVNGKQKPNQMGKDGFAFWITKYGVIPWGTKDTSEAGFTFAKACQKSTSNLGNGYNGIACTAWVLAKDNMDYLRGDVSW